MTYARKLLSSQTETDVGLLISYLPLVGFTTGPAFTECRIWLLCSSSVVRITRKKHVH